MKKLLFTTIALIITMLLVSCGTNDSPSQDPPKDPNNQNPTSYTITWVDENGNKLADTTVLKNNTPTYSYSKTDTAEWDYTFEGWSTSAGGQTLDAIPSCTGNATYYAIVSKAKQVYSVSWYDDIGNKITDTAVEYGSIPSYIYTKADTAEWDYTFEGWSTSAGGQTLDAIPSCTGNATYYAIISKVKQTYTVYFNVNGGNQIQEQTVVYGSTATQPENPKKDGFRFAGWSTDINGKNAFDFTTPITQNTEIYAIWNEVLDAKALLAALLNGYQVNPYSFIPETMLINYSPNLVNANDIVTDYTSNVSVSNITYGMGEQWHMVLDNLNQSTVFFNALSVVEGLTTTSITAFNNYFDNNPSDSATHTFATGIYNVSISVNSTSVTYVLDYTAEIPVLGTQTVQIAMTMDVATSDKTVRIQIGDANALAYKITEDSYEFAIKYLGVRRAMFNVKRNDDGSVEGKIYEFLTVSSVEVGSTAEFYIDDDYATVLGNKADAIIGFTGYITEVYDVDSGRLVGYEVQETLSAIVYNTLWFNLSDIDGINSIKYIPKTENTAAKLYINSSSTAWTTKNVGAGLKFLSLRFDIEFKTQYVYSYDTENETYVMHKIEVPMIFVQEENYNTFVSDVKTTNNVTIAVTLENDGLAKIKEDYDTLLPIFIINKNNISSEQIISYIGNKIIIN
ncbi:MAG: hypothetical protein E7678_01195 [Ruminococcaceae bacterium]|nr:hypothetical protein [Oscillospiraceae bacterium]